MEHATAYPVGSSQPTRRRVGEILMPTSLRQTIRRALLMGYGPSPDAGQLPRHLVNLASRAAPAGLESRIFSPARVHDLHNHEQRRNLRGAGAACPSSPRWSSRRGDRRVLGTSLTTAP